MTKIKVIANDEEKLTLKQMQKFVGGYIEVVYLNEDQVMVIDDDGKGKGKPVNPEATIRATRNKAIFNNDWIAGDVIIMPKKFIV
tara:strand:+ start:474 stop:728 length:255 start_codon:yes stop_codon:yes gene_type:complete